MPTVTIDGVPYAYDEAGRGSALLLAHAGIADRRMWDDFVPFLSDRHRVVRLDLRGYGDSSARRPVRVRQRRRRAARGARDLACARLRDLHGSRRRTRSGPGPSGARRPAGARLSRPAGWEWDASMEEFDSAEAAALEQGDLDEASWLNVRFWLDGPSRAPDEVDAALRQRVYEMQRRAFEWENTEAEGSWLVKDEQHRLGERTAATLIVVGELDQPDFAAMGSRMAEGIPNARLERMPAVAHLPPMEAPEVFARLLLDHFSG